MAVCGTGICSQRSDELSFYTQSKLKGIGHCANFDLVLYDALNFVYIYMQVLRVNMNQNII